MVVLLLNRLKTMEVEVKFDILALDSTSHQNKHVISIVCYTKLTIRNWKVKGFSSKRGCSQRSKTKCGVYFK